MTLLKFFQDTPNSNTKTKLTSLSDKYGHDFFNKMFDPIVY